MRQIIHVRSVPLDQHLHSERPARPALRAVAVEGQTELLWIAFAPLRCQASTAALNNREIGLGGLRRGQPKPGLPGIGLHPSIQQLPRLQAEISQRACKLPPVMTGHLGPNELLNQLLRFAA